MDSQNFLWTIDSFEPDSIPEFAKKAYLGVLPYITELLLSKHPHRNGIMCPFVPPALKNKEIYFTYFDERSDKSCDNLISRCLKFYASRSEKRSLGAIIILFAGDFSITKLLKIHINNKEQCIRKSMMLGALYRANSAPSLHSSDYFPLRTPTPVLVLRDITASDLVFLEPEHYSPRAKYVFIQSFIRHFSNVKKSPYVNAQLKKARSLRKEYITEMLISGLTSASILAAAVTIAILVIGGP